MRPYTKTSICAGLIGCCLVAMGLPSQTAAAPDAKQILETLTPTPFGPADYLMIDLHILFAFGASGLTDEGRKLADELGEALSSEDLRNFMFEIQGHTDNVGSEAFNRTLSEQRAERIKEYLVRQYGLHPEQLRTTGYGENDPRAGNDTDEGRTQNRRVTVVNLLQAFRDEPGTEPETVQAKKGDPPQVEVEISYKRGEEIFVLEEGETLKSGEHYAIHLTPEQDGYVYLFQRDASGAMVRLFPNDRQKSSNPVQGGETYRIPRLSIQWLVLDEHIGEEQFILLGLPNAVPDAEAICQEMLGHPEQFRLASGSSNVQDSDGKPMGPLRVVSEDDFFTWQFWFRHE